ncbi:ATP synthase subunit I [Marinicella gelatinilytica]|uniref:ATP synthase subunit I n=1 Tax=Marinicella gelatinilytica TaxID=2996017 RepID=UPI002260CA1C|nr:ATP synthase subunit I [Marinicella gelatinilytica]MCX7546138.1 ATP synthase subunit I [Marinicella gelatinilytica]
MTTEISWQEVKKTVFKIPLYQMMIGVLTAVFFWLFQSQAAAVSALAGAAISAIGSLTFAFIVAWPFAKDQAMVGKMAKGEILKFIVIGALFYLAVTQFSFQLMALLIGFIITLLAFWVALLTSFK